MAKCEQCGAEFSNWFGDMKRLCPDCEAQQMQPPQPEILPPEQTVQGPPPSREIPLPPPIVTRVLIGINVLVFVVMVVASRSFFPPTFEGFTHWVLDAFTPDTALQWGANFGPYTLDGGWWRMLASTFLHGGLLHIGINMWALRNIGYTAELFYGRRNYLFIYLLSGLAGSAASLLRGPRLSVGASGAIFGVAGALAALVYFKKLPIDRAILRKDLGSIGVVIIANLALGANIAQIDNSAHVGGLIAGTILGMFLPATIFRAEREKRPAAGNVAIVAVCVLIVMTCLVARVIQMPMIEIQRSSDAEERQDFKAALAHAQRAVELAPGDPLAHYVLCSAMVDVKSDNAIPSCEKAVQLSSGHPGTLGLLASAYEYAGRFDDAIGILHRLVQKEPNSFEVNYNLGRLYLDHGRAGLAIPFLQEAARLNPADNAAKRALARALAATAR